MHDSAGSLPEIAVTGTLRWNDFEGGFWSLELEPNHPTLGASVVLPAFDPPAGAADDSRVRVRARPRPDLIGFQMAGPLVDVLAAELA